MKTCSKCKIEYPATLDYFYKSKQFKDNLTCQCKLCRKQSSNISHKKNKEIHNKVSKKYYQNNKKRKNEYNKFWYRKNSEYNKKKNAIRGKRIKQATPKNTEIQKQIKEIYWNCPTGLTIDHIIPIENKLVCGRHVPQNLRYLSGPENYSKNNKFKPFIETLINGSWVKQEVV